MNPMLRLVLGAVHAVNVWRLPLGAHARLVCSTSIPQAAEAAAVAAAPTATDPPPNRISLLHLYRYAAHPSPSTLRVGTAVLERDIPLRLSNLLRFLGSRQLPANLDEPRDVTIATLARLLHGWLQHTAGFGSAPPDFDEFASMLQNHRQQLDATMMQVSATFQILAHTEEWWQCPEHAAAAAQLLDNCHHWAVMERLTIAQHLAGWARFTGDPGLQRQHTNLVDPRCRMQQLLSYTVEDCRAFCVEKNGCAPEVQVQGDPQLAVVAVDSHVQFIIVEVLKNAMQAVLDRFGAWDVDEAEPVVVQLGICPQDNRYYTIRIHDTGGGVPEKYLSKMMLYYGTTAVKEHSVPSYGYSRDHGSPFKGMGVGVPMSRVYAHFMGGSVTWCVDRGAGTTTVQLRLPRAGFVL